MSTTQTTITAQLTVSQMYCIEQAFDHELASLKARYLDRTADRSTAHNTRDAGINTLATLRKLNPEAAERAVRKHGRPSTWGE